MKRVLLSSWMALTVALVACQKEAEMSTLQIRMTDKPLDVEEVNIDLRGVEVNLDKDTAGWLTMQANTGVYNLLGLQNGIDTLIAQSNLPTAVVKEIRLIVGPNNTVKADGQTHPLTIPSGAESGLKIKVNKRLQATLDTILIDFDAALSVKRERNGYKLRPVIRVK